MEDKGTIQFLDSAAGSEAFAWNPAQKKAPDVQHGYYIAPGKYNFQKVAVDGQDYVVFDAHNQQKVGIPIEKIIGASRVEGGIYQVVQVITMQPRNQL